jgi:hypothetical protein
VERQLNKIFLFYYIIKTSKVFFEEAKRNFIKTTALQAQVVLENTVQ